MFTSEICTLTIIGCGHSESLEHFNNNALISTKHGKLLIDCGHTAKHALFKCGLSFNDIDGIYISHVHGDHVFGLERAAYETRYKYNKRIKLFFHPEIYKELWYETLKGSLGRNSEGESHLEDYFDVLPIANSEFTFIGENFRIHRVKHTPGKSCHGISLGRKLFYTSDTVCIPELLNTQKYKIILHDSTTQKDNPVHASINQMLDQYTKKVRKAIYLMSYDDDWKEHQDIVNREFAGFAIQGQEINL
jgi:ribonuclease BN (tRNA processing enzyme)